MQYFPDSLKYMLEMKGKVSSQLFQIRKKGQAKNVAINKIH